MNRRDVLIGGAVASLASLAHAQAPAPGAADDPRPRSYALIDQPAPNFALPKLGGGTARLRDYRGRTLVLYFGGLWCPDCMVDGPYTNDLAHRVAATRGLAFLQIHTRNRFGRYGPNDRDRPNVYDAEESATAVHRYFTERGFSYPVAFDASRSWAHDVYRIDWSPSFLIVDRRGVIRRWRTDLGPDGAAQFFAEAQAVA